MKAEDMKRILIAGAGTMGRQIALHFAVQGCEVGMFVFSFLFFSHLLCHVI